MAGCIDDIVISPHKPEIAITVQPGTVTGQIPAVSKFIFISLFVFPVASHHGWPTRFYSDQTYFPGLGIWLISIRIQNGCCYSREGTPH